MTQEATARLEDFRKLIEKSAGFPILYTDATSLSIKGNNNGLIVDSIPEATLLAFYPKRKLEAMETIGLLPQYEGSIIHDT
jgi:hypothetical protein